MQLDLPVLGW
jgi:hypothetical protein